MMKHSGHKIRTVGFLIAMIPIVLALGLLSWLLVILTSPVTLLGMLGHKISEKRSRLKKKSSNSTRKQTGHSY